MNWTPATSVAFVPALFAESPNTEAAFSVPIWCSANPLNATLPTTLVCVANQGLRRIVSPLDATLTKNRGEGGQVLVTRKRRKDSCLGQPSTAHASIPLRSAGTSHGSRSTDRRSGGGRSSDRLGPGAGRHRLGPIGGIDPDVFRCEVAGPVTGSSFARVQIHHQRNVFAEKFVAGGAFVEIERLAAPQDGNARHFDVHKSGIKLHSGAPRSRKDTPPVRIAARDRSFDQRSS